MKYTEEEKELFQCFDPAELNKKIIGDVKLPLKVANTKGIQYVLMGNGENKDKIMGVSKEGNIIFLDSYQGLSPEVMFSTPGPPEFSKLFKIRVISSKISGKFFGKKILKKKMEGKVFDDYEIKYIKHTYINDYTICIRIIAEGERFSFAVNDIEFLVANTKGYSFPKDLSFKQNQTVVLKKTGEKYTILRRLYRDGNSKKICKRSTDRRRDVFSCINESNKIYHFYAEQLKHC